MQRDDMKATAAQIDYIRWLIQKTKSDPDWYDLEHMTRRQAQSVIQVLGEGIDAREWEG